MKHHREQSASRSVISVIISFFISVALILFVVSTCFLLTVFRPDFIKRHMDDNFFILEQAELVTSVQNVAASSQFPDTIFNDVFTLYMIEQDTTEYVQAIVGNITYTFNDAEVKQLLRNRLTQYAQENGIVITDQAAVDALVDSCAETYKNQVSSVPFLQYYAPIRKLFDKIYAVILIALTAFLILTTLFLFRIQPFRHRGFRYLICSLFGAALMILIPSAVLLLQRDYTLITLEPEYVRRLLVKLIRVTLLFLLAGGFLVGIAGLSLLPVVARMRKSALRDGQKHDETA